MKNAIVYLFAFIVAFTLTLSCSGDDEGGYTNTPKSDAKAITSFMFNTADNESLNENINATINENDNSITAVVPYGTDVSSLLPAIEASNGATVSPEDAQDFSSEVTYTITAEDGTKAQYTVTVTIAPNTEAKIISFVFLAENNIALEEDATAIIDEEAKTVTAYVPFGTDLTTLTPTLEVSPQAIYSPEGAQDFSSEVVYTITAGDESIEVDYTINVSEVSNSDAKIVSFLFLAENNTTLSEDITAVIDEEAKTVTAEVPYGTDLTALTPTLVVSPQANYSPEGVQNFSSEVVYTITAGDESTEVDYTVSINVTANSEAKILSFAFLAENNTALDEDVTAVIDEDTKTVTTEVPYGTDITALVPTVNVSPDASFAPEGTEDFSSGVVYTVTAQDESTTDYIVTVQIGMEPQRAALIAIYNANPGNTLGWDLEDPDLSNWRNVITDENGNVIELNLNFRQLTSIPVEIGQLSNLTSMDLGRNQLSSLPSEIKKLANLTELFLDENQLSSIPAEIGQLSNLEYLFLHANQLTSAPAEIGQLDNLKLLDLSLNQLSSIPTGIGQLSMLSTLKLDENQLTSVPAEIGQLSNLNWLHLDTNQLTSVPAEIGQLSNLLGLYLDNNQLASIPAEIGQLIKLTLLHLDSNQLTSVPAEVGQLSNLTQLYLQRNQLTSIPIEIGQLSNLRNLIVSYNQLTSIPVEIGQLSNLDALYLDENLLTTIPQEVCSLEINYGTQIQLDAGVTCE